MGIFNSSRGRRFLGVACGALLVAVGFRCWEDRFSNPQRLRAISTEISRHGGLCSDPEKSVVFVRNGVVAYSGPDSYNFSLGLGETGEVIGSEGHGDAFDGVARLLPPREIPDFCLVLKQPPKPFVRILGAFYHTTSPPLIGPIF